MTNSITPNQKNDILPTDKTPDTKNSAVSMLSDTIKTPSDLIISEPASTGHIRSSIANEIAKMIPENDPFPDERSTLASPPPRMSRSNPPPPIEVSKEQMAALQEIRLEFPEITAAKFSKAMRWLKENNYEREDQRYGHAPHLDPLEPHRRILLRFRDSAPEQFEALASSDILMIAKTECLQSILEGKYIHYINDSKNNVIAFPGKPASKRQSMNDIHYVAFLSQDQTRFDTGVLKTPLRDEKRIMESFRIKETDVSAVRKTADGKIAIEKVFQRELAAARTQLTWQHPNIIRPLSIGTDYIIYETSPNAMDLDESIDTLDPKETLSLLLQLKDAIETFWKSGFFSGDIKPGNILVLEQAGTDKKKRRVAKMIDNSLNGHKEVTEGEIGATPWYSPSDDIFISSHARLKANDKSKEEIDRALAIGYDMHAMITIARKLFVNEKIINAIPGLSEENREALLEYGEEIKEIRRFANANKGKFPAADMPKFPTVLNPSLSIIGNIIDMSNDLTLLASEHQRTSFWNQLKTLIKEMGGEVEPSKHEELKPEGHQMATVRPGAMKKDKTAR